MTEVRFQVAELQIVPLKYQNETLKSSLVAPWRHCSTLDVFPFLKDHCVDRRVKLNWQNEKLPTSGYSRLLSSGCSKNRYI